MKLSRLIAEIESSSHSLGNHEREDVYYRLIDVESKLEKLQSQWIELDEDLLITPFYIDGGTYEMYWCEMNVSLIADGFQKQDNEINQEHTPWIRELREALTRILLPIDEPFLLVQDLLRYIVFLKTSYLVKCDIVSVFGKKPRLEKYYLAFY